MLILFVFCGGGGLGGGGCCYIEESSSPIHGGLTLHLAPELHYKHLS